MKYELAELIIPRLENYKDNYNKKGVSIPTWVNDTDSFDFSENEINEMRSKWNSELDKMLTAFKLVLNYNTLENNRGYDEKIVQEGLNSFAKYFQHFWD